jgi:hypothetical protein
MLPLPSQHGLMTSQRSTLSAHPLSTFHVQLPQDARVFDQLPLEQDETATENAETGQ